MTLIAFIVQFAAFALFAASLPRHWRDIFGSPPTPRGKIALRIGGWALSGLSLALCVIADGWQFGLTWWFALSPLSAAFVLAGVSLAPQRKV